MKFVIPKKIQVGGSVYKVKVDDSIVLRDSLIGETDHNNQTVKIATRSKEAMRQTFLHEVVHIVARVYGVTLDEADVDRMANGFGQVIQQLKEEW